MLNEQLLSLQSKVLIWKLFAPKCREKEFLPLLRPVTTSKVFPSAARLGTPRGKLEWYGNWAFRPAVRKTFSLCEEEELVPMMLGLFPGAMLCLVLGRKEREHRDAFAIQLARLTFTLWKTQMTANDRLHKALEEIVATSCGDILYFVPRKVGVRP